MRSPGDRYARQARCALHFSPVFARNPETSRLGVAARKIPSS
ncbi:hypothetical protein A2U01_0093668, partial [Trifolium medium]|nr:hypothetical protein [Trifolium medium]